MRRILLLVGSLLIASTAHANYSGLAAFAAMNPRFPCDAYLNTVGAARYPAMSVIWDSSFGSDKLCIKRFLDANAQRPHMLQIHIWNAVAWRNRSGEPGDFFPTLTSKEVNALLEHGNQIFLQAVADRLVDIQTFIVQHGNENTQVMLSTGLEDNYSAKAYDLLSSFIRPRWNYLMNRNPEGSSRHVGISNFGELHGSRAVCRGRDLVANEDGATQSLKSSTKWMAKNGSCFARFIWRNAHQGRTKSGKAVYPRRSRHFEITDRDVRELAALLSRY